MTGEAWRKAQARHPKEGDNVFAMIKATKVSVEEE
jgi:molybdopterin-binding protein